MERFEKRKSMVGDSIMEMIKVLENTFNKRLHAIFSIERRYVRWFRTDGGEEYSQKGLQDWLARQGIEHEPTTACSPDSNEKTYRLNRTLGHVTIYNALSVDDAAYCIVGLSSSVRQLCMKQDSNEKH